MSCTETTVQHNYEKVPVQENGPDSEGLPSKYGFGLRHIQLAIILLCLTVNIIGRGHMGVTIVAMTDSPKHNATEVTVNDTNMNSIRVTLNNSTDHKNEDHTSSSKAIEGSQLQNVTEKYNIKTFNWPKPVQEMVLSSFFLGYSIMMFPMGLVCQRYGGKMPLQIALLTNTVVSIITPWLTIWGGWKTVCGCRILQGLSQAGTYPCIQSLVSKWAASNEVASVCGFVYAGATIGTVVAYQIGGYLGASKWGWPSTYYAIGLITFLCYLLLTIFGAASPMEHKSISDEEKNYIIGPTKDGNKRIVEGKLKAPWRAIITSKHVWGVLIGQVGSNAAYLFFFNQVPSYIHNILGINVKNSGVLSSLPHLASFFTSICFGWISDYCTRNNYLSKKNARRLFNTIAQVGLSVALIGASYADNQAVAVSWLVVAMATHVAVHAGWMVNHIDLTPNFSASLMATSATFSMFVSLLTPVAISYVVTDTTNVIQWRIMFFIISGFAIITDIIFVCLLSADVQPWNNADYKANGDKKSSDDAQEIEKLDIKPKGDEISENRQNDII